MQLSFSKEESVSKNVLYRDPKYINLGFIIIIYVQLYIEIINVKKFTEVQ